MNDLPSSTVWMNSAYVERWLSDLWPGWRLEDVRHDFTSDRIWYWVIPDYETGRSRILGIPMRLLERTTVSKLRTVLDQHGWMDRIEKEAILVTTQEDGSWGVSTWSPEVDESWHRDPNGGFFVAFPSETQHISSGSPARLSERFLALHGRTWSAMGPRNPAAAASYSTDELIGFVPTVPAAT